jgi:formate dehydrogenase subunit gamma
VKTSRPEARATRGSIRARVDAERVARFDRVERVVHWCNATLFGVLLFTGAALYAGPISTLVNRRELVRTVHVYTGLALPIPLLVALCLRAGRQLRADMSRLSRWIPDDFRWMRTRGRDTSVRLGKFNPGQKLNATFIGASILVMLATGSIMHWFGHFPDAWRTGATFVHDWFAIGLFLVIAGHILLAFADRDALDGMVRGTVTRGWARSKRPRWYSEVRAEERALERGAAADHGAETLAGAARGDR